MLVPQHRPLAAKLRRDIVAERPGKARKRQWKPDEIARVTAPVPVVPVDGRLTRPNSGRRSVDAPYRTSRRRRNQPVSGRPPDCSRRCSRCSPHRNPSRLGLLRSSLLRAGVAPSGASGPGQPQHWPRKSSVWRCLGNRGDGSPERAGLRCGSSGGGVVRRSGRSGRTLRSSRSSFCLRRSAPGTTTASLS